MGSRGFYISDTEASLLATSERQRRPATLGWCLVKIARVRRRVLEGLVGMWMAEKHREHSEEHCCRKYDADK
ncbi:hypothetical protein VB005_00651 [Metarhizium brunneum]